MVCGGDSVLSSSTYLGEELGWDSEGNPPEGDCDDTIIGPGSSYFDKPNTNSGYFQSGSKRSVSWFSNRANDIASCANFQGEWECVDGEPRPKDGSQSGACMSWAAEMGSSTGGVCACFEGSSVRRSNALIFNSPIVLAQPAAAIH